MHTNAHFAKIPFLYQQMHLLLNIGNVKIYNKISYIRSYIFRSIWTIIWELCSVQHTLHSTQYTHNNLKHMLPQHCIIYNDVSSLIISTKV